MNSYERSVSPYLLILCGFATSADPVKELRGGGLRIRESPGEFSQGPPGRGGGDLSGGVPGSSPWELGGGGLGVPGECNLNRNLAGIWPQSGRNLAAIWPESGRNLAGNLLKVSPDFSAESRFRG